MVFQKDEVLELRDEEARGKSLEEIRNEYAQKWNCQPDELDITVLDKPGIFLRNWKVRVCLKSEHLDSVPQNQTTCEVVEMDEKSEASGEPQENSKVQSIWDEDGKKFQIEITSSVQQIIPYPMAGALYLNGQIQEKNFRVKQGDQIEYIPYRSSGLRTWKLEVREHGLQAVAKVKHEKPGHYELPEFITAEANLKLEKIAVWKEEIPEGEYWGEDRLQEDLQKLSIVHGIRPSAWVDVQSVEGAKEVVLAEATLPLAPKPAQLEDFVGECTKEYNKLEDRIDFFGSKLTLVEEGKVLARKIPGKEGQPGQDVLGRPISPAPVKDFQFKLRKNVHLSEDGLEVIASCPGLPIRVDETTYLVENVYLLNEDVDLKTGSIEFPGDVFVYGNVQDGFHIFSQGKVEIQGSVSKAEIRAEKGLKIYRNVLGGQLVVGSNFVIRSELLRRLRDLQEWLTLCLEQTQELMQSPNAQHLKPGQCLKLILERRFTDLPKQAASLEKFIIGKKDELLTQELVLSISTVKRFLVGLGPLDPQAFPLLQRINSALAQMIANISVEVPDKLNCSVDYIQGAKVECGGSFQCRKGTYNSVINAGGDVIIEGVCRGGTVISGGNVQIRELGGSGVSITSVQFPSSKRLKVEYCHPNVVIIIDKEVIHIEEAYKNLEVYQESGITQVEHLRA